MAEKNSLWRNIRKKAEQNRRTGAKPKKPTAEMLRQERKIKAKKYPDGGPVGNDGLYNMQRALELGYTPDETGHWPSVDSETGMWLKSKEHPTAWMEYMHGYALNPEVQKQYQHPVVNPEGYFGENQLQYNLKAKGGQYLTVDGQAHRVYRNADGDIAVNHPKEDKGEWDTINLTNKSGANTIAEGVASVRKWHRENPSYATGGYVDGDDDKLKPKYVAERSTTATKNTPSISTSGKESKPSKIEDSIQEDVFEIFDPTGISSWNDALAEDANILDYISVVPGFGIVGKGLKLMKSPRTGLSAYHALKASQAEDLMQRLDNKAQGGYMYPDGGGVNPGKQKAVASTTDVSVRALPEGLFEQVKLNPPARQPQTISVVDKRKQNPITKKPINPNRDLVGGKFEDKIPIEIIKSSYKHGVDPATALSIGLLESRMGTTDPNVGHIMVDPYSDYMPGAEDMVLMIKEKQDYAKKLGYTDPLLQLQAYNGLGVLSNKRGEIGKSAYGLPIPKEGIDLRQNPLYGKKVKNVRDSVIMQSPDLVRLMNYYKPKMDGGYMYYAGGPMYYGNGGKVWKHIGAGAYGILEGGLDTLTFGATDQLTDKGFDWLTKVGNKNLDLNDPKNAKFLRTQQQIRGYSNVAGAIGTAAFTGQWGSAIGQSAKGVNTAFQATEGLSDDFKKWSNIGSQAIGIGAGLAGGSLNSAQSASKIGQAATKFGSQASKVAPYANQAMGMLGNSGQPLWQQAEARQDYLNSPEYLAMKEIENQAYVNQGLSFASTGGNINNSLNLQNSMRGKYNSYKRRYSKGGTFQKFGINEIPDSAGYHHENAYGGVPIGPNAMAEGGEFVLDNNYVVSDEVDGMNTQTDEFGRTMAQNLKRDLSKYTMRDLNSKNKDSLRRPMDPLAEQTINQIKQKAMMETEMARAEAQAKEQERQAMVEGALQYAAAGGKLNDDITKIVKEEYAAAYGGYINPKKYKGLNMPYSSGGKLPKEVLRARVEAHMSPQEADAYVENYAKGGGIHIKESKKGTFTAAAKKRGKSVQEFARQVLANKGNYSSAMVKKANFARNAAKWHHAEGGNIRPDNPGFNALPEYVQAKIMNNMAHGGPVVSNVNQDFDLYAQNRGGMMMAQGGNMYLDGGDFDNIPGFDLLSNEYNMMVNQNPLPIMQSKNLQQLPTDNTMPEIVGNVENMPALSEDATYLSPYQKYLVNNYPEGLNNLEYDKFGEYTGYKNPNNSKKSITESDSTTPWSEEPWYSKAARYGQAIPGVIASITALQNKKRKLTPERISPNRIDLERSRITTKEEGRRALDSGLRTIRGGSGSTGQLAANTRDAILNYNKNMGANIAKLYETEENANAQLAQQAALANQQYGNAFKQLNEEMFQNAQTQAIAGLQDTTGKLAGAAGEERKQYLQEWIAKNKLKTRDFIQGPDGSYYYEGPDGTLTKV